MGMPDPFKEAKTAALAAMFNRSEKLRVGGPYQGLVEVYLGEDDPADGFQAAVRRVYEAWQLVVQGSEQPIELAAEDVRRVRQVQGEKTYRKLVAKAAMQMAQVVDQSIAG